MDTQYDKWEYPYYRLFVDKSTLREIHYNYSTIKPLVNTRNTNGLIATAEFNIDTPDFDVTTDWFVEPIRVLCHKIKWKTKPLDQFQSGRAEFLQIAKRDGPHKAKVNFANTKLIECDIFPTPVAYWIYRLYKPRKILDMCAGWGDRLSAAILYNPPEGYTGVDPNSALHQAYREIIDHYAVFQDKSKYMTIDSKFELAESQLGPDASYDLMFTSPPYFSAEQHTDAKFDYGDLEHWLSTFMFPSLDIVYRKLAPNGRIVMAIGDLKDVKYMSRIIAHCDKLGLKYEGVIQYSHRAWRGRKIQQDLHIWYKRFSGPLFGPDGEYTPELARIVSPPLVCVEEPLIINGLPKTIRVFRDDYLNGGTKLRAAVKFLAKYDAPKIAYRGPTVGAAQIALAVVANLTNRKAYNILNYWSTRHENTDIAAILGSTIVELEKQRGELPPNAERDAIERTGAFLIPLGFEGDEYRNMLIAALKRAAPPNMVQPKNVWVVSTTGNLMRSLYELFPLAHFHAVLVGFQHEDYIDKQRTTVHHVPESFYQEAKHPPPYPSTSRYDAKIWQFIATQAEDGDVVWNVA